MPFITVEDLHKAYGGRAVLDGAELVVEARDRIAVIGRNGAGKSTLCRIILGFEEYDAGRITFAKGARIGFLRQDDPFLDGETGLGYLERAGGRPEWDCARMAAHFRVANEQLAQPALLLPGGVQTRLRLASMLLTDPDFLVLDEPTNHLDLRTLVLLERFLQDFRGGWMVVSHDRAFLERTCTQTVEVEHGRCERFPGTVSASLAAKAERREQITRTNAALESKLRDLEDFVARNKARASTASRAQSKQKELDKLADQRIAVAAPEPPPVVRFPRLDLPAGWAIRAEGLAVGYGTKVVAKGLDLDLDRGTRLAVVGDNGQGKSTLLNTIAGTLAPLAGGVRWSANMRLGHYAQHVYQALPGHLSVKGWLDQCARTSPGPTIPTQEILDLAGAFLFRGDDVEKPIKVLSGGERGRLTLAGLILQRVPALLLDEPTNHLDVESVDALADALVGWPGTVVFVTHDRGFAERVSTHVVEVRDGRMARFPGTYADYVATLEGEAREAQPAPEPAKGKAAAAPAAPAPKGGPDRRALEREWAAADKRVKALEAEQAALCAKLEEGYDEEAAIRLADLGSELAAAEEAWLALGERLGV
jgi:ATP-binding cassette subfamily F protein 3